FLGHQHAAPRRRAFAGSAPLVLLVGPESPDAQLPGLLKEGMRRRDRLALPIGFDPERAEELAAEGAHPPELVRHLGSRVEARHDLRPPRRPPRARPRP